MQDNAEHMNC